MKTRKICTNSNFIEIEYYDAKSIDPTILKKEKNSMGATYIKSYHTYINIKYITEISKVRSEIFKIFSYTGTNYMDNIKVFRISSLSGKEYVLPAKEYSKFENIIKKEN